MRIATWNVNSLKARLPRVEEWLGYAHPDVLCMQETKMADGAFPVMAFEALGYEVAVHGGSGRWNGVAIASRVGIEDPVAGFSGEDESEIVETRFLSATCGGVRVSSVYAPNGRAVGTEHYDAKLAWLDKLADHVASLDPDGDVAICGDFNIAPEDRDVWDPSKVNGATHVSPPERERLQTLFDWGLVDAFRTRYRDDRLFSWWDYRAGDFHQHRGMRIDLVLLTRKLAERVSYALIDRFARKGKLPSDHAPLLVDVD